MDEYGYGNVYGNVYGADGLDTGYGSIGEYGGTGEYTTDAGTDVTVEDHSGSGYADVYGPGYGADDTYSNYQAASQEQNELYSESTQAYINGDVDTSAELNYAIPTGRGIRHRPVLGVRRRRRLRPRTGRQRRWIRRRHQLERRARLHRQLRLLRRRRSPPSRGRGLPGQLMPILAMTRPRRR